MFIPGNDDVASDYLAEEAVLAALGYAGDTPRPFSIKVYRPDRNNPGRHVRASYDRYGVRGTTWGPEDYLTAATHHASFAGNDTVIAVSDQPGDHNSAGATRSVRVLHAPAK